MRIVLILYFGFLFTHVYGQQQEDVAGYIPTDNVEKQKAQKRKNSPDRKSISIIIKNDPKKILYGNPCMVEETHRMGFEYAIQTSGIPGSVGGFKLMWHNVKVYTKLFFTRSPFWKVILNSRVDDCRERTGDMVG